MNKKDTRERKGAEGKKETAGRGGRGAWTVGLMDGKCSDRLDDDILDRKSSGTQRRLHAERLRLNVLTTSYRSD